MSSKRSLANRENRLSLYMSTRQGPDRTGSASVSLNTLDLSPAPTSLPDDTSGSGASTSAGQFTAVPDPLATDQGFLSTSSDAANEIALSDSVPKRAKRNISDLFMQYCIDLALRFPSVHVGYGNRYRSTLSGVVCNGG